MDTKLTELVFLLDRSGSMNGLEKDTIGGFNGMIENRKTGRERSMLLLFFLMTRIEIIHDRFSLEAVKPLTEGGLFCERLHSPSGCHWFFH